MRPGKALMDKKLFFCPFGEATVLDRESLIKRLEPFAQGCFSGNISEWPQLKPLLADVYEYLSAMPMYDQYMQDKVFARQVREAQLVLEVSECLCQVLDEAKKNPQTLRLRIFIKALTLVQYLMVWLKV